jgi:cephalosporin hydroxylase
MSGPVGQQLARLAPDSIYPPANSEPTDYHSGTATPMCGGRLRGLGGKCRKWVGDMWNYQEILFAMRPSLVIEFGTRYGGSAMFVTGVIRQTGQPFKLLSVDISHDILDPAADATPIFCSLNRHPRPSCC